LRADVAERVSEEIEEERVMEVELDSVGVVDGAGDGAAEYELLLPEEED